MTKLLMITQKICVSQCTEILATLCQGEQTLENLIFGFCDDLY